MSRYSQSDLTYVERQIAEAARCITGQRAIVSRAKLQAESFQYEEQLLVFFSRSHRDHVASRIVIIAELEANPL